MENVIPKTKLKIHVLKLLQEVQETGIGVIITDKGKPVAKIIRYTGSPFGYSEIASQFCHKI